MGTMKKSRIIASAAAVAGAVVIVAAIWPPFSDGREKGGKPHDEVEKISIVISSLGMTFPPGINENNNPYLDYIEENTDLDINVFLPPSESYEEKLNMIMTSGNLGSLPDMMYTGNKVWLANNVKQGKLQPLDEWIDRYGADLKAKIPEEAWRQVTFDGHIYAVPSMNEVKGVELMYARKDWLDRLGLQPPRTLDEYERVIRAFAKLDPDGNGADDTYGLLMTENMGRTAPFFGAFGIQLNQWTERDGELVYSNTLPEAKQALDFLHRLYQDGLIDPEFPMNRTKNVEEKIASGKVGLFSATWYDTRGPIELNRQRDPLAEWIPLDYPVGPQGAKGVYASQQVRGYGVVPFGSTEGANVVRMLNFIAGEGHKDLKLGFENEIWHWENGKMVTNFAEHDKHLYRGIYSALVDVVEPELDKQRLDSLGEQFHLYDNLQRIKSNLIADRFTGLPTPSMGKYMAKLNESMQETFIKMIVGVTPIDQFDSDVARWKQQSLDEMTREVNEWYAGRAR